MALTSVGTVHKEDSPIWQKNKVAHGTSLIQALFLDPSTRDIGGDADTASRSGVPEALQINTKLKDTSAWSLLSQIPVSRPLIGL